MFALPGCNYPACNIQSGRPQTLTDYAAVCGIQRLTEWVNEVWLHIFICSLCFNLIYSKRRRSGAVLHHINICLIACASPLVYFCKTAALLDTDCTERRFLLLYFLHNSTGQYTSENVQVADYFIKDYNIKIHSIYFNKHHSHIILGLFFKWKSNYYKWTCMIGICEGF